MSDALHFEPRPLRSRTRQVAPEWIDYNGHMNVAYCTLAIDTSLDEIFDDLGIGVALVERLRMGPMVLVNQIHYLAELLEGEPFHVELQVLDIDHKRMHTFATMIHEKKGIAAATYESLTANVDLEARKTAPYPPEAFEKIEALARAHAGLPRPKLAGASIGIRR